MSDRFYIRLAMLLFIIIFPLLLVCLFNYGLEKGGLEKAKERKIRDVSDQPMEQKVLMLNNDKFDKETTTNYG